jgi:adenylate kinase
MKYHTYLLFGAPGSGKGTQGRSLGSIPRFFHCACGDVFRTLDTRTKVGRAFLEHSSKGQLVPDEITVELWRAHIEAAVEAHEFKPDIDVLVLDGIPRNVGQAKIMDDVIDVQKVFHLSCPDRAQLFSRLKKRALKESKPVLDYYSDRVQLVDATQPPARVLYNILSTVANGTHAAAV